MRSDSRDRLEVWYRFEVNYLPIFEEIATELSAEVPSDISARQRMYDTLHERNVLMENEYEFIRWWGINQVSLMRIKCENDGWRLTYWGGLNRLIHETVNFHDPDSVETIKNRLKSIIS